MIGREDMVAVLEILKAAFPNFHPGDGTLKIYELLLGDLELDELKVAVLASASEPGREFAPSVGAIRGAVMELRRQARGLPSASEAWQEVHHALFYGPKFSHPIIEMVANRFGMRNLGMSENEIADRAHFMKAYDEACDQAMRKDVQLPIVRAYIENHSVKALDVGGAMKKLADSKAVK